MGIQRLSKLLRMGVGMSVLGIAGTALCGCNQYQFGGTRSDVTSGGDPSIQIPPSGPAAAAAVERQWPYQEKPAVQDDGARPFARLQRLTFAPGSSSLDTEGRGALREKLGDLQSNTRWKIVVVAGADRNEAAQDPLSLSESRAKVVKDWLIDQGVDAGRISTMPLGSRYAEGDAVTPATMASDRRAEVWAFM